MQNSGLSADKKVQSKNYITKKQTECFTVDLHQCVAQSQVGTAKWE